MSLQSCSKPFPHTPRCEEYLAGIKTRIAVLSRACTSQAEFNRPSFPSLWPLKLILVPASVKAVYCSSLQTQSEHFLSLPQDLTQAYRRSIMYFIPARPGRTLGRIHKAAAACRWGSSCHPGTHRCHHTVVCGGNHQQGIQYTCRRMSFQLPKYSLILIKFPHTRRNNIMAPHSRVFGHSASEIFAKITSAHYSRCLQWS